MLTAYLQAVLDNKILSRCVPACVVCRAEYVQGACRVQGAGYRAMLDLIYM